MSLQNLLAFSFSDIRTPALLHSLPWLFLILALISVLLIHSAYTTISLRKNMPPGPLGLPFIGNSHAIPNVKPWRAFTELNAKYGSIISLWFGRTPVIVLGKAQHAWDLLEKRSDIYSSRPRFIMGGEILSDNMRGLMLPNNEQWRKWRKILHLGFNIRRVDAYKEIQSLESKQMMIQLLEDPSGFEQYFQRYAASVVTSVSFGRRVESVDEWIVAENMKAMDYLTSVNIPGKYIVESLPWLLKLPRSLQWFRGPAEAQRARDIKLYTHLLDDVKQRQAHVADAVPDCLASQTLANMQKQGLTELDVAYAMSTPFGAGIETTAGTMLVFVLAMLHFPHVMRKAQSEIDSVIGHDRMPDFSDYDSLPYVRALIDETLRWRPIAILGGSPHAVTEDDWYDGMFIPKGSTVFANFDGIMQDPELFPSPTSFLPERFLTTTNPRLKSFELPFGFGRRICPGMHLAHNSLFIGISRVLWAFDISPIIEIDKDGNKREILPDIGYDAFTNGFNSRPVSYKCTITPRDEKVVECIKTEWEDAKKKLGNWSW